ncbi:hypothetical protein NKH77_42170 [Streptomyces sp. M19]
MPAPKRAEREWDLVLFGATGFAGRLTAEYLAARAPPGSAGRWRAATPNGSGAPRGADRRRPRLRPTAPAARGRPRPGVAARDRRRCPRRRHRRRPVSALRRAAGRRMRRGGHRLRRSDRRAGVRGPDVPAAPRPRPGDRRPAGARLRLRLSAVRPRRPLHGGPAARRVPLRVEGSSGGRRRLRGTSPAR